jgi:hypothetical protein
MGLLCHTLSDGGLFSFNFVRSVGKFVEFLTFY